MAERAISAPLTLERRHSMGSAEEEEKEEGDGLSTTSAADSADENGSDDEGDIENQRIGSRDTISSIFEYVLSEMPRLFSCMFEWYFRGTVRAPVTLHSLKVVESIGKICGKITPLLDEALKAMFPVNVTIISLDRCAPAEEWKQSFSAMADIVAKWTAVVNAAVKSADLYSLPSMPTMELVGVESPVINVTFEAWQGPSRTLAGSFSASKSVKSLKSLKSDLGLVTLKRQPPSGGERRPQDSTKEVVIKSQMNLLGIFPSTSDAHNPRHYPKKQRALLFSRLQVDSQTLFEGLRALAAAIRADAMSSAEEAAEKVSDSARREPSAMGRQRTSLAMRTFRRVAPSWYLGKKPEAQVSSTLSRFRVLQQGVQEGQGSSRELNTRELVRAFEADDNSDKYIAQLISQLKNPKMTDFDVKTMGLRVGNSRKQRSFFRSEVLFVYFLCF